MKWFPQITKTMRTDEDGSVSVEFILVMPLLVLLLGGSFVWFDAFRSNSLTAKVAYTIADITSRYEEVDDSKMVDVFDAHKKLLPGRITDGWLRISSICWNGTDHRVLWSYLGDDTYAAAIANPLDDLEPRLVPLVDADIPTSLMPLMSVNDTIILTEVFAAWSPLVRNVGFSEGDWSNRLVSRPRFKDQVIYSGGLDGYPNAESLLCPTT